MKDGTKCHVTHRPIFPHLWRRHTMPNTATTFDQLAADTLCFSAVLARRSDLRGDQAASRAWRATCRNLLDNSIFAFGFTGDEATTFRHDCMEMIQSVMQCYEDYFRGTEALRAVFTDVGQRQRRVDVYFDKLFFEHNDIDYDTVVSTFTRALGVSDT